ncbi:MAG: GH25 family lysozyme [Oscillospiraceae bacterium]
MNSIRRSLAVLSAAVITALTAVNTAVFAEGEDDGSTADYTASKVYGDVNGDNISDIKDVMIFSRQLVSGEEIPEIKCVDLNSDGITDIYDLILLKHGIMKSGSSRVGMPMYDDEHIIEEGISGIDVSKWQGVIDWQGVKDSGIEFVMIKAGEGLNEEVNFRKNIEGAKSVGINCGVYWFANATSTDEAILEAQACLDTISGYELEYPVAYDYEYRSMENSPAAEDSELKTQIVKTFLLYIQREGYYPLLYSNLDFLKHHFNQEELNQFDLWYARYNVEELDMPCFIWQYSCTGEVGGISVDVDLDTGYKDFAAVIKKYHWN